MELNDAINHLKESIANPTHKWGCEECKAEHEQLLEWLEDYKQLKADYIELDNQIRKANTENDEWNTRASSWIPCSAKMPEDDEEVLFAVAYPWDKGRKPKVTLGRHYTKNEKGWWTAYYGAFLDYEVTHWMPLPSVQEVENNVD